MNCSFSDLFNNVSTYFLIYDLFNSTVISSDYVVSNDRIINVHWVGKYLEAVMA